MGFAIDRHSPLSFPRQVERQAVAQVVAGRLQDGDRIPSVRQLARQLGVARQTAERIHEAMCEALLAEVRPRSPAFVGTDLALEGGVSLRRGHLIQSFLKETLDRARRVGLEPRALADLLAGHPTDRSGHPTERPRVTVPVLATRDGFDCMVRCLDPEFPVRLVRVPSSSPRATLPRWPRVLLCGYQLRARAERLASERGYSVIHVRYNVGLLDACMGGPAGGRRYLVTRDADNAESTRAFLSSAYPEVPTDRYQVAAVRDFLNDDAALADSGPIWVTVTAVKELEGRVARERVRLRHPTLSPEFVEELRCLPLLL